jgi:peptide-methionine (R)-S-oxide reductase
LAVEKRPGTFRCAGCGSALFDGKTKFESGTGWPSFNAPIPGAIETVADDAYPGGHHSGYGAVRTELVCAACGSHIGHVFGDGPAPTGLRYCANGAGLTFTPIEAKETAA